MSYGRGSDGRPLFDYSVSGVTKKESAVTVNIILDRKVDCFCLLHIYDWRLFVC